MSILASLWTVGSDTWSVSVTYLGKSVQVLLSGIIHVVASWAVVFNQMPVTLRAVDLPRTRPSQQGREVKTLTTPLPLRTVFSAWNDH